MKFFHVIQFCTDLASASGVNCFCTELNRELRDESRIVRKTTDLPDSKEFKAPLLIHIHGIWLREHHRAAKWARRHGIPIVWSTHGMTAPWSMHHKWWKKLPAWWLYQKRDLKHAAAIHCTTDLEVEWNNRLGFKNCFVAPLGAALSPASQSNNQTVEQSTVLKVLFVGRIYPVKGLMNLVRAAALIKQSEQSNNQTIRFRIVGPDQAGHLAELQREAAVLGVAGMFDWAGPKFGSELAAEYDQCDVLILPSFTENFGATVVDALSHGKPVIASRFTPWKVLEEERCGWWIDNTPDSLAQKLQDILSSPDRQGMFVEMGRRGRRLVERQFTWKAVAQAMMRAYKEVEVRV